MVTVAINVGLNVLNYHSLPTGAFDANGNVRLPPDFSVPAGWSETVGRVTQSPDFGALLKILGTLTVPRTDWYCWRVALSFRNGTLRVVLVRDVLNAGSNEQIALNWSSNLWNSVVLPLQSYAGRQKVVPPVVTDALTRVIDAVTGSSYWDKPLNDENALKRRAYQKWQVTSALGVVRAFVDLIGSITSNSKILVTVLWFYSTDGSVPANQIRWAPLHQLYDAWNVRTVHYWWNSGWFNDRPTTYPFVYSATLKRRGWGVTDVAHQPWELARACYPNGNWPDLDIQELERLQKEGTRCRRRRTPDDTWEVVCDTAELPDANAAEPATTSIDDGTPSTTAFAADLDVFSSTLGGVTGPPDGSEDDTADSDVAAPVSPDLPDADAAAPLIFAHLPPSLGGDVIGPGTIQKDLWIPDTDVEALMPPTIWIPSLGVMANFIASGDGWQPASDVPAVVAVSAAPLSEPGVSDDMEDRPG